MTPADQSGRVGANVVGKVATVTQFLTVAAAVLRLRYTGAHAVASGVLGIWSRDHILAASASTAPQERHAGRGHRDCREHRVAASVVGSKG